MSRAGQPVAPESTAPVPGDLPDLARSFRRHLAAANLSALTIKSYIESVHRLTAFLVEQGMPTHAGSVTREHVEAFVTA